MVEIKYRRSSGSYGFRYKKEGKKGEKPEFVSYKLKPDGLYLNGTKQESNEVPEEVAKQLLDTCGTLKLRVVDEGGKPVLLDANGQEFDLGGKEIAVVDEKAKGKDESGKDDKVASLTEELEKLKATAKESKDEAKEVKASLKKKEDELKALQSDYAALVAKSQ